MIACKTIMVSTLTFSSNFPQDGGVKVHGDAVSRYFYCGFVEIFILSCGIVVFQDCVVLQ